MFTPCLKMNDIGKQTCEIVLYIFEKEGSKINVLVARDGVARDKLSEEKLSQLLRELIPIFRDEFGPHNIF